MCFSHRIHKVEQQSFLFVSQKTPLGKQLLLFRRWCIIPIEHIGSGGIKKFDSFANRQSVHLRSSISCLILFCASMPSPFNLYLL